MEKTNWGTMQQGFTFSRISEEILGENFPKFSVATLRKQNGDWMFRAWAPRRDDRRRDDPIVKLIVPRSIVGKIICWERSRRNKNRAWSAQFQKACENISWEDNSKMTRALSQLQERDNAPLEPLKSSIWGIKD